MEIEATSNFQSLKLGGVTIRFVHSQAADPYSLIEWTAPPGSPAPPVHLHHRTAEGFYGLRGTFAFLLGAQRLELTWLARACAARAAAYLLECRRCRRLLPDPAVALGFERYFRELAERLGADQSEEAALSVRRELSARYDIEVVGPPSA